MIMNIILQRFSDYYTFLKKAGRNVGLSIKIQQ